MRRDALSPEWNSPVSTVATEDWAKQCAVSYLYLEKALHDMGIDMDTRKQIAATLNILNCEPRTVSEANLVWRRWVAVVWRIVEDWYRIQVARRGGAYYGR